MIEAIQATDLWHLVPFLPVSRLADCAVNNKHLHSSRWKVKDVEPTPPL